MRWTAIIYHVGRNRAHSVPQVAWHQFSPDRKGTRPGEHLAKYGG
jgi:hypothetical protein